MTLCFVYLDALELSQGAHQAGCLSRIRLRFNDELGPLFENGAGQMPWFI